MGVSPGDSQQTSFSQDLVTIENHLTGTTVTVAEIDRVLQGRGFATICMVLCLPFIQPIPLPGLSIAFGLGVMALGLRLALGSRRELPGFVRSRQLEVDKLRKIIHKVRQIFVYVEKLFKPRLLFMLRRPFLNIVGISIIASGLALSLPLPPVILFSNSIPAWSVIILALGYLERDGLMIAIGHGLAVATWIYFAFWWEAVKYGLMSIEGYLY